MHIGLIGGIGPAATDYYYRRLISTFASKKTWLESEGRKQMMRYWHLPEYWRKHGFPSQCRPIGESDFECH